MRLNLSRGVMSVRFEFLERPLLWPGKVTRKPGSGRLLLPQLLIHTSAVADPGVLDSM